MKYSITEIVRSLTTFQYTKKVWIKALDDRNTFPPWPYPVKNVWGEGEGMTSRHQKSVNYNVTKYNSYNLLSTFNYILVSYNIISFNYYRTPTVSISQFYRW